MSDEKISRSGPLRRWAHFTTRHPWRVIGAWLAVFAVIAVLAPTVGGTFADRFTVPNTESQQALDTLNERFPELAGDSAQVVFQADGSVTDPDIASQIETFVAEAQGLPEVIAVASPFDVDAVSPDGSIAYATVQYGSSAMSIEEESVDELLSLVESTNSATLQTEVGGQVVFEVPEVGIAEIVGLFAAIIVLLIMFGSLIAAGLPIVTAIFGVGLAILLTTVLAAFIDFSTITTALVSMLGLGIGIDYALFIITRFREERAAGHAVAEAVVTATDTAGRAVLFAGAVVVVALLGLFAVGIPFIGFLGLSGAIVITISMLIAVGFMPAILQLLGPHLDRWAFVPNRPRPIENTFGSRLTTRIQKTPVVWLAGALIILGALAYPALFNAQLGTADAGTDPAESTTRQAYDLIAEGFGPGANGPLLVVAETDDSLNPEALGTLVQAIQVTDGVLFAGEPIPNATGDTAVIQVIPTTAPQDSATEDLITTLRNDVIPGIATETGLDVHIGGATATFADLGMTTTERLPIYIMLVAGLSVLILMTVFRSVLVPIKAAVVTLMSFFAGYGAMVLVFQEGFLGLNNLFGVDQTGPIESFLPIFLFGILFGLSMDYEVFLISRVHESWTRRQDNAWALRNGIGASGRVVLAAGAIMTSVFLAFTLGDGRIIKEIGLGLGVAILVDVLVVRMIVVPSFMSITGNANWWFPRWLDRIVPRLDVEGAGALEDSKATDDVTQSPAS